VTYSDGFGRWSGDRDRGVRAANRVAPLNDGIGLVSFMGVTSGAIAVALTFGARSARVPGSEGP